MFRFRWQLLVVALAFICGIALVALGAFVIHQKTMTVYAKRDHLISTEKIMSTMQAVQVAANEAEANERGYLASDNRAYLISFRAAVNRAYNGLTSFTEMAKANRSFPPQEVSKLNERVSVWLSELQKVETLYETDGPAAAQTAAERAEHMTKIQSGKSELAMAVESAGRFVSSEVQGLKLSNIERDKVFILFASVYLCALLAAIFVLAVFLRQKTAIAHHSQVQLLVTQALVDSTSLDQAAECIIRGIGETYQFTFGAAWLVDEQEGIIRPFKFWQSDKVKNNAFLDLTRKTEFKKGVGMPGRVWETASPHWITDVVVDPNYPRSQVALQTGFHSGLGFPINKNGKVVGIVEFYFDRITSEQRNLIDLLSPFGYEIGQFIERIEAREALIEEAMIAHFAAEVGGIVTGENDLSAMLQRCADLCEHTLGTKYAAVWVLSADQNRLELRGKSGNDPAPNLSMIPVDDQIIEEFNQSLGNFVHAGELLQKAASRNDNELKAGAPILAEPLLIEHKIVGIAGIIPGNRLSPTALRSLAIVCKGIAAGIARRQMESRLRQSDRLFKEITGNIEEMIWVTQPGGFGVKWVSPALARMFGSSQEEIIRDPLAMMEAIHPDDQPAAFAFFQSGSSRPSTIEYRQRAADNEYKWIWSRIYPTFDATGKLAEVYGVATDITKRKEAEKRVNEFYSMVSHELRTPLTSIHASLRIMEGGLAGQLTDKSGRLVTIARVETDRLVRLINDILDIRKLEAGMLELNTRKIEPEQLVERAFSVMKGMADNAGVTLLSQLDWNGSFCADQDRTLQMLENLLSNAIKFSARGGNIKLIVEQSNGFARFTVQDWGPGIPPQQLSKLFGKFQQLDSSDTRPKGGTGLGLAITKAIAEQHGGRVGVESVEGVGSKFWIELPIMVCPKRDISTPINDITWRMHNILLIENDAEYATELITKLGGLGFNLMLAPSFDEAEQLLQKMKVSAIVADLDTSEADGLLWLERQKANPLALNTVVLANAETFRLRCENTKTIAWHSKPMSVTSLKGALSFAVRELSRKKVNVLVAEPTSVVSELIALQLKGLASEIVEATDGQSTIAKAKLHRPDLIILDTRISNPSAFEIVEQLRMTNLASKPLLVYTPQELTHKDKQDLTLGNTQYLTMSQDSEQNFLATVRELLDGNGTDNLPEIEPALTTTRGIDSSQQSQN